MAQASEQVENPYWRAVLSDIEAYLKYQLLKNGSCCGRLTEPKFVTWVPCRNYAEVENPVEARFFRETDVVLTLLEKGDYRISDQENCFLNRYSVYLATFGVYP